LKLSRTAGLLGNRLSASGAAPQKRNSVAGRRAQAFQLVTDRMENSLQGQSLEGVNDPG
jgi:hypothetical protein